MSNKPNPFVRLHVALRTRKLTSATKRAERKTRDAIEQASHKTEMEIITDKIIADTIGDSGIIWLHYKKLIANFKEDSNPLGEDGAKTILQSLLLLASSQRRLLPSRVAQSIECGAIFDKYFGKMIQINDLAVLSYNARLQMEAAENKYKYQRELLEKVTDATYEEKYSLSAAERGKKASIHDIDIIEEVLGKGGDIDREQDREQN